MTSRSAQGIAGRKLRRVLGILVLLVLFFSGPMHLFHHHADSIAGGDSHQCVPCSAFQHVVFIGAFAIPLIWSAPVVALLPLSAPLAPPAIVLAAGAIRAPPAPSV